MPEKIKKKSIPKMHARGGNENIGLKLCQRNPRINSPKANTRQTYADAFLKLI